MALYQLDDHSPQLDASAWVADSASVIGRVHLGAGASVWFNAVLRGDTDTLTIGDRSNVQDGAVLHADPGVPLHIGEGVTVGHQAMLHGCTIGEGALIGIQAVVLNRSRIGAHSLVGAGALVTEGQDFPPGSLILGAPARVVRPLTAQQIDALARTADRYVANAQRYRTGLKRVA